MSKSKVSIDFSGARFTDSELSVEAKQLTDKTDGNPAFPTPSPELATIRTTIADYDKSLEAVKDGSREDTVVKNRIRAELEDLLSSLGLYVQQASNGDEALILSAGFSVHRAHEPIGPLVKPQNLMVKPASSNGAVLVSCNAVPHASSYLFEYRELVDTSDNGWVPLPCTKSKLTISGLTSGKQYAFRITAVGSTQTLNWSDEVKSYVL
ncbi:fibronectin type III domain-containing protein [Mangrovibacterium lignilyticum]|uniref:fibronectin type III domain-containing protein n=1 Tax=Mangrovibacterium lignilyticum TaxID=2668052 RepID=UPI0013D29E06|nr:fibronectin type III domain-containing protein [Mangrovibacterium lignilyticum]